MRPLVAHAEKQEGDDYDADYGPEIQELGGENVLGSLEWYGRGRRGTYGIFVGEDCEVIALDVHETQNYVFPAINLEEPEVSLPAVFVNRVGGIESGEDNVVEEGLESWDGGSLVDE